MTRYGPLAAGILLLAWLLSACSPPPAGDRAATPPPQAPPDAPVTAASTNTPAEASPPEGDRTQPYVPVVRGPAEIAYLKPVTKVENNLVVTTIRIRNRSTGAIAGLKLEEYWWDKAGNPMTGSTVRMKTRLEPGETTTLTLETPKKAGMYQCNYRFSHANGTIKAVVTNTLE